MRTSEQMERRGGGNDPDKIAVLCMCHAVPNKPKRTQVFAPKCLGERSRKDGSFRAKDPAKKSVCFLTMPVLHYA